jgi:hypothetical protein
MPIADVAPAIHEAADTLEVQAKQIEALRNIVTNDAETKAGFIARVRAILGKGNV